MENKNLLIVGVGQYGCVAREIAEDMRSFDKISFLDDKNESAIGTLADMDRFVDEYTYAFVAIGNPVLRLELIDRLEKAGYRMATLISPRAYVSPSAQLLGGVIVEPMAVISTASFLGRGTIVSAGAIVNHNCYVGDVCHLDCNSTVLSNSIVPTSTRLPYGEIYEPDDTGRDAMFLPGEYSFEDGV